MSFVQSDVDIMNQALRRVGSDSIVLNDANAPTSKPAKIVTSYYANTVKEVLRLVPWNFSITRASVTGVADTTTNYSYKYAIGAVTPAVIRTLDINGDDSIPYKIEGSNIFCNETSPIKLRYISMVAAPFSDSIFIEAVVSRLASKICYAMNGDAQLAQVLYQEFALNMSLAKQLCVAEDKVDVIDLLGLYAQSAQLAISRNKVEG